MRPYAVPWNPFGPGLEEMAETLPCGSKSIRRHCVLQERFVGWALDPSKWELLSCAMDWRDGIRTLMRGLHILESNS